MKKNQRKIIQEIEKHIENQLKCELYIKPIEWPGAPEGLFPILPLTSEWCLDKAENIHILRKGFPLVPDFSSTVHLATGRTLLSIIGDLGDFEEPPSFIAAMRGYITLSRATDAEGLLISRPFSPKLFSQGPQPWPTLIMQCLQTSMSLPELLEAVNALIAGQRSRTVATSEIFLKNIMWTCGACGLQGRANRMPRKDKGTEDPVTVTTTDYGIKAGAAKDMWMNSYFQKIVVPGCLRRCSRCQEDEDDASNVLKCELCEKTKPHESFSKATLHNRFTSERDAKCLDCLHPKCTNPTCQCCKQCGDYTCRDAACAEPRVQLNPKQMPKTLAEKHNWKCLWCRGLCLICPKCSTTEDEMFSAIQKHHIGVRGPTMNKHCTNCVGPLVCMSCDEKNQEKF